jgi:CheY-like chemotaxis protein
LTVEVNESMKRVLLVDDDSTILLGTGVRLKSMGYTVYTAKDAVSAVSAVVKNDPDVVVLDLSLPAGDGFLVAERLQNLVVSAATPIIFITANENPALRERAMNLGAAAFITKPFDATTLADAIEQALAPGDNWLPQASGL